MPGSETNRALTSCTESALSNLGQHGEWRSNRCDRQCEGRDIKPLLICSQVVCTSWFKQAVLHPLVPPPEDLGIRHRGSKNATPRLHNPSFSGAMHKAGCTTHGIYSGQSPCSA